MAFTGIFTAGWSRPLDPVTPRTPARPKAPKAPKTPAIRVECMECGRKFTTRSLTPTCARCGSVDIEVR